LPPHRISGQGSVRHRERRSFTVEIKRAVIRRAEEARSTPAENPIVPAVSPILPRSGPVANPTAREGEAAPAALKIARRILPDLLAAPLEETFSRVDAPRARAPRRRAAAPASVLSLPSKEPEPPQPAAPEETSGGSTRQLAGASPMRAATSVVARKAKMRRTALAKHRRAKRRGLPGPVPAPGSRWKRRLPPTCW
jgi:hypothetical protein